ncbi:MAG: glycosyltransferase [Myxococcaceae bacterium]|nr:glycosyltransferase [Myxococcaceae bacterium]
MSDLPRLLLCSFDVIPAPTGSSRRITEYLRGLSDHFNVVGLTAKTPDHSHIERYHGARLLRVPVGTGDLLSKLQTFDRAVRRQLESEEYAVVHFTDPFGGYALCELRETYGYKLVYDAQTFPSQELRFIHPELEGDRKFLAKVRRQELYCLMNADRVITGSEVTRGLIQSLGVSPKNIEVLRAPVDLEPYTEAAMGPPDASPMRVLYLGSQVGWQGLPTLLRAMQHALREVDLRLVVVGPAHTAWKPLLEDLIEELKLGGKVELQPPVAHDDLHKVLALADVGVLPLEDLDRNRVQGGAASKVGEYLAAGRPVIASDLPMARELLTEEVALFHEPGDPEDISECLVALAKNPKRRVRMGKAAFALARRQHDANAIRARLRQVYLELTGLAPSTRPTDDEAGGPAPTLIGTPMSHVRSSEAPGAFGSREAGTDPDVRSGPGRRSGGTDPAIDGPFAERSASGRFAADRRRERRRRRREELADENAAATHPAIAHDEQPVVMGTPIRDDGVGTDPNAASNDEPRVVLGTPLREPPELHGTEPSATPPSEPRRVMGTPLREPPPSPPAPVDEIAPDELRATPHAPAAHPSATTSTPEQRSVAAAQQLSPHAPAFAAPRPAKPPAGSVVFAVGTPLEAVPQPKLPPEAVFRPLVAGTPLEALPQPKLPTQVGARPLVAGTPLEALPQPKLPTQAGARPLVAGTPLEALPQPKLPTQAGARPLVAGTPLEALPQPKLPTDSYPRHHGTEIPLDAPPQSKVPSEAVPRPLVAGTPLEAQPEPKPPTDAVPRRHGAETPEPLPQSKVPSDAVSRPLVAGTPLEALPQPKLPTDVVPRRHGAETPEPLPQSKVPSDAVSRPLVAGTPLEALPEPKLPTDAVPRRHGAETPEPLPQSKVPSDAVSRPLVAGTPLEALPQPKLPTDAVPRHHVAGPPEALSQPKLPARPIPPVGVVTSTATSAAPPPPPVPVEAPSVVIDPALLDPATSAEGPEEVDPDEVHSADDEGPSEISADQVVETSAASQASEVESADDAVVGPMDDPPPVAYAPAPMPESRLDAWFAQLVHGYCPPEGAQFARPTPPTNFPGRDGPPPETVQPGAPPVQSVPSRTGGG